MTIEAVTNSDLEYFLVSFGKNGEERDDDPGSPDGRLSGAVKKALEEQPITDVFFMSHGWKGDVPAAKEQYQKWILAMLACEADRARVREVRPDFMPLLIGLHWPSLPWGDEDLSPGSVSFSPVAASLEGMVEDAADKVADSGPAREALMTVFKAAAKDVAPPKLSPEVIEAYQTLYREAGLTAQGPGAAPGADLEDFDPSAVYAQARGEAAISFGGSVIGGGILSVLRQLSFWTMKARARSFGERGAASLLRELQQIAGDKKWPAGNVRFHLMGHSFGCIVVSGAIAGAGGDAPLAKPVDSVLLAQGALSLWAYCKDIPDLPGTPGYFQAMAAPSKVAGPIVITRSEHDKAVGTWYPIGARKDPPDFGPGKLPTYGGLGTYGARGPGIQVEDRKMLAVEGKYEYKKGVFYNLDGSTYICEGGGASGAHSDIAKPEVAHAFWQAVILS